MSGRAGYDLGLEMGELMDHPYQTKLSQFLAKAGNILGYGALAFGVFVGILFQDLVRTGMLISVCGLAFFGLMHWLANAHDKKKACSTNR